MRFICSNITSSCTYGIREKRNEEENKGLCLEEQERMGSDCSGHLLTFLFLLVFFWGGVGREGGQCATDLLGWSDYEMLLLFHMPSLLLPSPLKPWTVWAEQHLNTLGFTLQDLFPLYGDYTQRECSANHKPEKACKNISNPAQSITAKN